jgi:hypothetical protein
VPLQNEVSGTTPGTTTPEDYTAWRARFGNTGPGAGSGAGGNVAAVPEPVGCSLVMITVGLAIVSSRPTQRSKLI